MAEYIDQFIDHEGNPSYPRTLVAAIKDIAEKVVLNGSDQLSLKGKKNFLDGLQVDGKDVLTDTFLGLDTCTDLYGVTKSGFYYYDEHTKNLPYMEQKEFMNGYFFAVFNNEENGIVVFLGSYMYVEKYRGAWRTPFSPFPVKLWTGGAQAGDVLTFPDDLKNYTSFKFYLNVKNGSHVVESRFDGDGKDSAHIYLTPVGLNDTGKGMYVVELTLQKTGDRTVKIVSQKFLNTETGNVETQVQKSLVRIDGFRN